MNGPTGRALAPLERAHAGESNHVDVKGPGDPCRMPAGERRGSAPAIRTRLRAVLRQKAPTIAHAEGLALGAAARTCTIPFIVAKLVTVTVMELALWQHAASAGIPGWAQLRTVFAYWDGQQYLQIAAHGYPANVDPTPGAPGHLWAYMPGYPLLIRGLTVVLHDDIFSGAVASAMGEFIALVFLARLVSAERDERAARLAVWLLAFVPYGVFLTAVYTEGAFLAATAASLYYMRQGRFIAASVAGALATAIRVTGLTLLPAIALEYILQRRWRPHFDALALFLIPAPFVLYCGYAAVHAGDALAFFHIQASASFNRQLTFPWTGMTKTLQEATSYTFAVEFCLGVLGFLACATLWTWPWLGRRVVAQGQPVSLPPSLALYATAVWLLAVSQPYWLSLGRYEIALLPVVILIADAGARRAQLSVAAVVASAGLMAYITTLWSQGIFVS